MAPRTTEMNFLGHLEELRWCLIKCAISLAVCAIPCSIYWERIFDIVMIHPLHLIKDPPSLIVTSPIEMVMFALKIGIASGFVVAAPAVFYHIWRFIGPGLYKKEKQIIFPAVIASSFCFLLGVAFCYFLLPYMVRFLSSIAPDKVKTMYKLDEYLSFIVQLTLSFGLIFELPVISWVLSRFKIIGPRFLIDKFRYAFVIILILAAILSPPDILSQIVVATPMTILYGISILISWLTRRKEKKC